MKARITAIILMICAFFSAQLVAEAESDYCGSKLISVDFKKGERSVAEIGNGIYNAELNLFLGTNEPVKTVMAVYSEGKLYDVGINSLEGIKGTACYKTEKVNLPDTGSIKAFALNGDFMPFRGFAVLEGSAEAVPINVTASEHDGNYPVNSIDKSFNTFWKYKNSEGSVLYEFDREYTFSYIGISFCKADNPVKFKIETSLDGLNFSEYGGAITLSDASEMYCLELNPAKAKYIRILSLYTDGGIREINFYTQKKGSVPVLRNVKEKYDYINFYDISDELKEILKKYAEVSDESFENWAVSMYEPESGAFDFSLSAKNEEAFSPAIEGTLGGVSAIGGVWLSNFVNNGELSEFVNLWKQKLIDFYRERQDPDDGYFYDPLFGKQIDSIKKERDLNHSLSILGELGAKPFYLTPGERIRKLYKVSSDSDETLPEYLKSEQNLRNWLQNDVDMVNNPYYWGDRLGVIKSKADKLGYTPIIIEFLKNTQNSETGLWGGVLNADSLNGSLKVSCYFNKKTEPYPLVDKMIESDLKIIKEMGPGSDLCADWNRLALIDYAIDSYEEFDPVLKKRVDSALAEVLELTYNRLMLHKKSDGGFSGEIHRSNKINQGAYYCLGLAEGDTNAAITVSMLITTVFKLCKVTRPADAETPTDRNARANRVFYKLKNIAAVPKHSYNDIVFNESFDGFEINKKPARPDIIVNGQEDFAKVVPDPGGRGGNALMLHTDKSLDASYIQFIFNKTNKNKIKIEYDILVTGKGKPYYYSLFGEKRIFSECYTLQNGLFTLSNRNSETGYGDIVYSNFAPYVWTNVRSEYEIMGENAVITYFINGAETFVTNKYWGSDNGVSPAEYIDEIYLYNFRGSSGDIYIDNLKVYQ